MAGENAAATETIMTDLATANERARSVVAAEATRRTAEAARQEAATARSEAERITATLERLDALKATIAKRLKIPGIERWKDIKLAEAERNRRRA